MTEAEEMQNTEKDSFIEKMLLLNEKNNILLERLTHKYESFVESSIARLLQLSTSHGDRMSDNLKMNQMILTTLQLMQEKTNSSDNICEIEKKVDYIYDVCIADLYLEISSLKKKIVEMLYEMKQTHAEIHNVKKGMACNNDFLDPIKKCVPIPEKNEEEEIIEIGKKIPNQEIGEHVMRFIAALQPSSIVIQDEPTS